MLLNEATVSTSFPEDRSGNRFCWCGKIIAGKEFVLIVKSLEIMYIKKVPDRETVFFVKFLIERRGKKPLFVGGAYVVNHQAKTTKWSFPMSKKNSPTHFLSIFGTALVINMRVRHKIPFEKWNELPEE